MPDRTTQQGEEAVAFISAQDLAELKSMAANLAWHSEYRRGLAVALGKLSASPAAGGVDAVVVKQPYHGARFIISFEGASLDGMSYPSAEAAQAVLDRIRSALSPTDAGRTALSPATAARGGPSPDAKRDTP